MNFGTSKPWCLYYYIKKSVPTSQKTLHYKVLSLMQFRKIVFLEHYTKSTKSYSEIKDVQFFLILKRENAVF